MTEMVAAHLERVAKELAGKFDFECTESDDHDAPPNCRKCAGMREELAKVVAAALAACAREARLDEAKWWADGMHAAGGGEICKYCERIAALERAAGEK